MNCHVWMCVHVGAIGIRFHYCDGELVLVAGPAAMLKADSTVVQMDECVQHYAVCRVGQAVVFVEKDVRQGQVASVLHFSDWQSGTQSAETGPYRH